ncbi:DUF6458 family protein [Phytohabitans aurantiacus]|jgi:uncharacterized membrane protein|uniref:DUF6458 domain-containing protein n=1 Tax=Phytohabitans aurantiacus TaxID=3016789 RepID=A0ABQ5QQK5_9ACTN|nr:DUF6458 family protein [Phytohabitans aurantiacus]GLH96896.1 hypothetical protein Pa4123_21700 [Phytohabitans aurantiacus]
MGIGGGIFLIAVGAVLAYALQVDPWWIDLDAMGVILMLSGAAILVITLWYWRDRRRRVIRSIVEENRLSRNPGEASQPPFPPDASPPPVE